MTITQGDYVRVVQPRMRIDTKQGFTPLSVQLDGDKRFQLDNFVPGTQQVLLRVEGLNLPLQPARAVLQVSTKPAIALVWLGALLVALGCGLAVVRRQLEWSPARKPVRSQPGWLGRRLGGHKGPVLPQATYR